jgi:hypothetical protein
LSPVYEPSDVAMGRVTWGKDEAMNVLFWFSFHWTYPWLFIDFPAEELGWMTAWEKDVPLWPVSVPPESCTLAQTGVAESSADLRHGEGGLATPWELGWNDLCLSAPWEAIAHSGSCPVAGCHLTWAHWGKMSY